MKKIFSLIVTLILAFSVFSAYGCKGGKDENTDPYASIDRSCLFGIDEPVLECKSGLYPDENGKFSHTVQGFDMQVMADLCGAMGVKSLRFRIPSDFMVTAGQYKEEAYEYLKDAIAMLHEAGVTLLIGLIDYFPRDTGFQPDSGRSVPYPDDENYDDWMNSLTGLCYETCKLFPEITYWEMGNEMNSANFFHPNGYNKESGSITEASGAFNWADQVQIYTDYMYYAAKGIHRANPNNKAVTGGYALTGVNDFKSIAWFIEDCYTLIEEGKAPSNVAADKRSTNPRDYFDAFSWHPYLQSRKPLNEDWLDGNNTVYKVVIDHGDEGLPVFFTEFGFHADGDEELEEIQIEYMNQAFEYMLNDMPYVMACHSFRMYQCQHATTWGGEYQIYWGYFTENTGNGFIPTAKAIALQKLYGGTGDLYMHALNQGE